MVIPVNDESNTQTPPHEGDQTPVPQAQVPVATVPDESNTNTLPMPGDQTPVPQVPGGPPKPYDEMTPAEKDYDKKKRDYENNYQKEHGHPPILIPKDL